MAQRAEAEERVRAPRRAGRPKKPLAEQLGRTAPKPVRHLKVLLAEDNPTNRHVATRMLSRMGHTVDAVEDGAQAISAAATGGYDVILMDVMMP